MRAPSNLTHRASAHRPASAKQLIATLTLVLTAASAGPILRSLAQTTSGRIIGSVRDKTGKGIPDALVQIVNEETKNKTATRTDDAGNYNKPMLPPGFYTITASKQGYLPDTYARFPVEITKTNELKLPKLTLKQVALLGKVVDGAGNILTDARVIVTDERTGLARAVKTNQYGNYTMSNLPPGSYSVAVSWSDDTGYSFKRISLLLDRANVYAPNIRLEGAVSRNQGQPQQPSAAAPAEEGNKLASLVRTADAARSSNFNNHQINALPLGGATAMRSFDELALLVPGVVPPPYTPGARGPGVGFGVGTAGQFAVNGLRARALNFSVDGSDNNDPDVGVRRQGFVALVPQPVESVKDFSVSTLLWDAELGRNFGAQVNAVSDYGSNQIHGQAYAFFTDSRLNARNFFDTLGGKDPFTHAQTGLVIGGPALGGRVQLFGSFEHQDVNASSEQHFGTPTLAERSFRGGQPFGVLPADNSSIVGPFSGVTPLGGTVLSFYPLPNNPAGPLGRNTLTRVLPDEGDGSIASLKVTLQVTPSHQLHARFNFSDDDRVLPRVNRAIDSTIEARTRSSNLSLVFDSAFGSMLFNQARFSFGRTRLGFSEYPGGEFVFTKTTTNTITIGRRKYEVPARTGTIGNLAIEPFSPIGVDPLTFPQSRASNTFQYADSLSLNTRGHALKFGGNIRRYQLNSRLDRLYRPQVIYASGLLVPVEDGGTNHTEPSAGKPVLMQGIEQAALGIPSSMLQTITAGPPDSTIGLRFTEYHAFVNDNWRVRPGFTIDYGLRWEYNTVPREVNNRIGKAIQLQNLPRGGDSNLNSKERTEAFNRAVAAYASVLDGRSRIYEPDLNNFGPHFGLAWSPDGGRRTVIRAGYGIYFDTILGSVVSQSRNVFPNEIPINVDPSFLAFDVFNLNNPEFLAVRPPGGGDPVPLFKEGSCNQFGTCNQFGGSREDFVAMIGQLFLQNRLGGLAFTLPEKNIRTPYAQQWHLSVEREFGDWVASGAYVGTKGTKLQRLATPNLGPNVTPVVPFASSVNGRQNSFPVVLSGLVGSQLPSALRCQPNSPSCGVVAGGRPIKDLGAYQIFENSAASNYHALQLEIRKRYSRGYQISAAYTWSHAMDDVSDVFPIAGSPNVAQDSNNFRGERASAGFDLRQRFAASLVWDLPFYRNVKTGVGRWLGGWQIASIFQAHTGQPFTLNVPFDANLDGNLSDRPSTTDGLIFLGGHGVRRVAMKPGVEVNDFIVLARNGTVGRNTVRGDGFVSLDAAVSKSFALDKDGKRKLQFRFEMFNAFNRANFGLPVRIMDAPGFGSAIETVVPARTLRFAVKFRF
ncbi:MAG TPA: carboxypeptidase-like regulatory domain-containing protein [Blastocatellia bacterium]|nr:carboxypeptidase-like regulatory domain-containing protein [Blastocatellia bacterium]